MATYPAESFYRGTIRQSMANNTSVPFTLKVSKIPTLTSGLLTVSPNTANEEIIEYSGVDGTALTITVVKRGINPSTQALLVNGTDYNNVTYQKPHSQNDTIRGDVTHLHIIQDYGNLSTNKLDKSGGLRDTMGIAQDIGATNGSTAITVTNTTGWSNGAVITGTGIPGGTTIVSFVPNTSAVLSAAFTGTTGTVSVVVGKRLLLEIDNNNNEVRKVINPSSTIIDTDKVRLEKTGGYYEDFTIQQLQASLLGSGKINKSFNILENFSAGELGYMTSLGVSKYIGELGSTESFTTPVVQTDALSPTTGVSISYESGIGYRVTAFRRSGLSITMGSPTLLRGGSVNTSIASVVAINSTTFVAMYGDNSSWFTPTLYARVGTISGTTITLGTEVTIDSGTSRQFCPGALAKVASDKFVIGYVGEYSQRFFVCCSVSGTTITLGTPLNTNNAGTFSLDGLKITYVSDNKVLAVGDNGGGVYSNASILTFSGTTITSHSGNSFGGSFSTSSGFFTSLGGNLVGFAHTNTVLVINCTTNSASIGTGITISGVLGIKANMISTGGKYFSVFTSSGITNVFVSTGTTIIVSGSSTLTTIGNHLLTSVMDDGIFIVSQSTIGKFVVSTNKSQIIGSASSAGTSGGTIGFELIGPITTTNSTIIKGIPAYISSTGGVSHSGMKAGPSISATEYISNAQYI